MASMLDEIYQKILEYRHKGKKCVLAQVVEKTGSGPARVGGKLLYTEEGYTIGTIGGGALERLVIRKCQELINTRAYVLESYNLTEEDIEGMVCGGKVKIFYEYVGSGIPVVIFGFGHVGRRIYELLKELDYFIYVVDPRQVPDPDKNVYTLRAGFEEFFKEFAITEESFIIVNTSSHHTDYQILYRLYTMNIKPRYIGLLASNRKTRAIVEKLRQEIKDLDLSNLYAPIGLDIGGSTPEEIAISVIAEIQGIRYDRKNLPHKRAKWYIS